MTNSNTWTGQNGGGGGNGKGMGTNGGGTSSITFRLDDHRIEQLRKLAKHEGVSVNVMANNIFDSYLQWDYFSPKIGFAQIPLPVLKGLFDSISDNDNDDEEKVKELADEAASFMRNAIVMIYGKFDIETLLAFVTRGTTKSGMVWRLFDDHHHHHHHHHHNGSGNNNNNNGKNADAGDDDVAAATEEEKSRHLVIYHGTGMKGSLYCKIWLEKLFNEAGYKVTIEAKEKLVMITIAGALS